MGTLDKFFMGGGGGKHYRIADVYYRLLSDSQTLFSLTATPPSNGFVVFHISNTTDFTTVTVGGRNIGSSNTSRKGFADFPAAGGLGEAVTVSNDGTTQNIAVAMYVYEEDR